MNSGIENETGTAATRTSFPTVTILTIVFVVLKLTKSIDWSWLWVLSPLWIFGGVIILVFIGLFIGFLSFYRKERRERQKI